MNRTTTATTRSAAAAPSAEVNALAVLPTPKEPRLYTLVDYLKRDARSERKLEYRNGQIQSKPPSPGPRNILVANISARLANALDGSPYVTLGSKQKLYLPTINYSLYPDAVVVCEAPAYFDDDEILLINPVLIVEVLSKSTRRYDQLGKFAAYKTLPSFREYVLVEQDKISVETRFCVEPHLWRDRTFNDATQDLFFESLGVGIHLADVYKNVNFDKKK